MDARLREAYAYCELISRKRAKNFYWAFVLMPPSVRRGLCASYAFCRLSDDIGDDERMSADEKTRGLSRVESALARVYEGSPGPAGVERGDEKIFLALADTVERFPIPRRYLEEILAGVKQDLHQNRYNTFGELVRYCYRVASAVGLVCIEIFGHRGGQAVDHAVDLGIAMQLTNILRDVEEDARRDRIYLPLEDLDRFGVSEDEILTGHTGGSFRNLMAYQVDRARDYFAKGCELIPLVLPRARLCPMVLANLYEKILDRIERREYQVFGERIGLATAEKLAVALGAWVKNLAFQF